MPAKKEDPHLNLPPRTGEEARVSGEEARVSGEEAKPRLYFHGTGRLRRLPEAHSPRVGTVGYALSNL